MIMSIDPLADKWRAFGWHVLEADGHDLEQILSALGQASRTTGRPTVIIARTVKGRGVPFMENKAEWHGKAPSGEQLEEALRLWAGEAETRAGEEGPGR